MLRAALASVLLVAAQPALAACPEWLVSDMQASAVPLPEITRMCGPALTRSIAPPAAAAPAPIFGTQGGQVLGAISGAREAAPARRSTSRCVAERGEACTVPSARPLGSPCWCGGKDGPREGTIR